MTLLFVLLAVYFMRLVFIKPHLRVLVLAFVTTFSDKCLFPLVSVKFITMAGPFNNIAGIYPSGLFALLFILAGAKINLNGKKGYIFVILLFLIAEFMSSHGIATSTFWMPVIRFIQLALLILVVSQNFSREDIFEALYETCLIWIGLEFVLTLLYPILGFRAYLSWFVEWAAKESGRRAGYNSAVGTFGHPANLAYFCAFVSFFYYYCYKMKIKKQLSFLLFCACLFIIFFTYSRTTYVTVAGCLVIENYFIKSNKIDHRVILYALIGGAIFYLLSFIPFIHQLFFESDADSMYEARLAHWEIAIEIFKHNPWFGCGINSDVYYMYHHFSYLPRFLKTNPIHNVHLIVLAETGIVGMTIWVLAHILIIRYCLKNLKTLFPYFRLGLVVCLTSVIFEIVYDCTGWSLFGVIHTPFLIITLILIASGDRTDSRQQMLLRNIPKTKNINQ